jgi:hypothetical protein
MRYCLDVRVLHVDVTGTASLAVEGLWVDGVDAHAAASAGRMRDELPACLVRDARCVDAGAAAEWAGARTARFNAKHCQVQFR